MKVRYCLLALAVCLAGYSCRNDDHTYSGASEREFMTMFRIEKNSGFTEDPVNRKSSGVISPNHIYLVWFGVEGCAGYHIRMKMGSSGTGPDRWTKENVIEDIIIDDPDQLTLLIENLQYNTQFHFAIRTLSKKGMPPTPENFYTPAYENDPYHSLWYGYGDGQNPDDYYQPTTEVRPGVPEVISWGERTETSVKVFFRLNIDEILNLQPEFNPAVPEFQQPINPELVIDENNNFVMHYLILEPTYSTGTGIQPQPATHRLTSEDKARGWVEFDGLVPNVLYIVNGVNENTPIKWDGYYNTEMVRMRGPLGEPVLIRHELYTAQPDDYGNISNDQRALEALSKKYNASRIDVLLNDYMSSTDYAEGTVFLLEPGKTYFMGGGIDISKGLTLKCEDPANRPTVLMGVGFNSPQGIQVEYDRNLVTDPRAHNFSFGRPPRAGEMGGIILTDIVMENIKFEVPNAYNWDNRDYLPGKSTGLPNYFINQLSTAMPFRGEKFHLNNCDFQGMVRGFIRVQGQGELRRVIDEFIIENCLIYNCGVYEDNGRGYSFIAGDGKRTSNLFNKMMLRNNSFVNISYHAIFGENTNLAWAPGYVWDVALENNTFLNFGTRSNDRLLFELGYPPNGSKFTAKKNLFIVCPARDEDPLLYRTAGMRIRSFPANITFDIADNYSTNVFPGANATTASQSIFSTYPFTHLEAGGYSSGEYNLQKSPELEVKLGIPSLAPWELMEDPYPLGPLRSPNGHRHNMNGLYYRNTPEVRNHEIVTKGIGDPRWRARLQ